MSYSVPRFQFFIAVVILIRRTLGKAKSNLNYCAEYLYVHSYTIPLNSQVVSVLMSTTYVRRSLQTQDTGDQDNLGPQEGRLGVVVVT